MRDPQLLAHSSSSMVGAIIPQSSLDQRFALQLLAVSAPRVTLKIDLYLPIRMLLRLRSASYALTLLDSVEIKV